MLFPTPSRSQCSRYDFSFIFPHLFHVICQADAAANAQQQQQSVQNALAQAMLTAATDPAAAAQAQQAAYADTLSVQLPDLVTTVALGHTVRLLYAPNGSDAATKYRCDLLGPECAASDRASELYPFLNLSFHIILRPSPSLHTAVAAS